MSTKKSSGYQPSEDEAFMNERQQAFFKDSLEAWRDAILSETQLTIDKLKEHSSNFADIADRASSETDHALELRTRDRQRKLISKIDAALKRIEDGTYGYCSVTGNPIGIKRLIARPVATMSIEAQESHEREEKHFKK